MDATEAKVRRKNPMVKASCLSNFIYRWTYKTFLTSRTRPLVEEDIYDVTEIDSTNALSARLQASWDKELEKLKTGDQPSLIKALLRTFSLNCLLLLAVYSIVEVATVAEAVVLHHILDYFRPDSDMDFLTALGYAAYLGLGPLIQALTYAWNSFHSERLGMHMKIACSALVYKKSLKLKHSEGKDLTGKVVNLLTNDVSRFTMVVLCLPAVVYLPLTGSVVIYLMWQLLGLASLAAVVVLFLILPVLLRSGGLFASYRLKVAELVDVRLRYVNELISGIKIVKMNCWENAFHKLISDTRSREVVQILKALILKGMSKVPFNFSGKVMVFASLITFVLLGGTVKSELVFPFITFVNILRVGWHFFFPVAILHLSNSWASTKRLQAFLLEEEMNENRQLDRDQSNNVAVSVRDVTARWAAPDKHVALRNINVKVDKSEFVLICGPVGSGKSALLHTLLGEMHKEAGQVAIYGSVAYSAQAPWVFSSTLRQNILFGRQYDSTWYSRVIRACALDTDIDLLPEGDLTLIGERGVTLSGGQRARVSLARALYHDADVYLLDDPFSAVDTAVGEHIFKNVFCGLLRDRTRILVTHQLQFLQRADRVIVMNEGRVEAVGTYKELLKLEGGFVSSLIEHASKVKSEKSQLDDVTGETRDLKSIAEAGPETKKSESKPTSSEEGKQQGSVSWRAYKAYLLTGTGLLGFLLCLALHGIAQTTVVMSDIWLAYWCNAENKNPIVVNVTQYSKEVVNDGMRSDKDNIANLTYGFVLNATSNNGSDPQTSSEIAEQSGLSETTIYHMGVYAGLVMLMIVTGISRMVWSYAMTALSAKKLHNLMLRSVMRARMRFFDTNSSGRILNRFSKDTDVMDDILPDRIFYVIERMALALSFYVVSIIVNPWLIIVMILVLFVTRILTKIYLKSSRDLQRFQAVARSPVLAHVRSTADGLTTVRAFRVEKTFLQEYYRYQDNQTAATILYMGAKTFYALVINSTSSAYVASVAIGAVLLRNDINTAAAGFILSFAAQQIGVMSALMFHMTNTENDMVSVERVREYIKLEPEGLPLPVEHAKNAKNPSKQWPTSGDISCENLNLRYDGSLPYVLHELNFTIKDKEKVGIIGRTGAGKSSLITALFRLAEPEGRLRIDGVDIRGISLQQLRSAISVIPQDPVLFRGSLRRNLDPFNEHKDFNLWIVLQQVQMEGAIRRLPEGLACSVSEGGANFSVGERQLLCLARALLRRNRILILDEATANVDHGTDAKIQKAIKENFKNCTVLTIAHRLHTVMESQTLMVVDSGNIAEFGSPVSLMRNSDSLCHQMASRYGPEELQRLQEIATEASQQHQEDAQEKI